MGAHSRHDEAIAQIALRLLGASPDEMGRAIADALKITAATVQAEHVALCEAADPAVADDVEAAPVLDQLVPAGMRSLVVTPCPGNADGTGLVAARSHPGPWSAEHVAFLGNVAALVASGRVRAKAERGLSDLVHRYEAPINQATAGIWEIDANGATTFVNPHMAAMLGYTPADMLGRSFHAHMSPEATAQANANLERRREGIAEQHDFEFLGKDGRRIVATLETWPTFHTSGAPSGAVAVVIDVTERRRAEREREALRGRIADNRQHEVLGRIAAQASHELSSVFTAILAAAHALAAASPTPELDAIAEVGARGAALTRRMLAVASRPADHERIAPGAVLRGLQPELAALLPRAARLEGAVSGRWKVTLPDGALETIARALVANASDAGATKVHIQALDVPSGSGRIAGQGTMADDHVLLTWTDDGSGMDTATLDQALQPFFTTRPGRDGLGLVQVSDLVAVAGGTLSVHSKPGKGTRVEILLPRAHPVEQREPGPSEPRSGRRRVLLVEDEGLVRRVTGQVLDRAGFEVLLATDGIDALEVFQAHGDELDLVVTDVVMPRLGGHELAARLRVLQPDLPILFVSAYDPRQPTGERLPDDRFLAKPWSPEVLVAKVRALLHAASGS